VSNGSKKDDKFVGIVTAVAGLLVAVVALLTYLASRNPTEPTASGTSGTTEKSIVGSWSAIDEGDHCREALNITKTAGAVYQVVLYDTLASTFCKTTPATVTSTGTYSDHRLSTSGTLVCEDGRRLDSTVTTSYIYHPGTDTITEDASNVVWTRSS
jgi:hypothetical protein